jgi:hypothetical protein
MEMEIVKPQILKIEGEIYTSSQGVNKLMQFYNEASQYKDTDIVVDFYNMDWIDANLTALLHALTFRLKKDNNLQFSADFDFLSKNFNVLFRNGWLKHEDYNIEDNQNTTIPCASFYPSEELKFVEYIDKKLMCHRSMGNIDLQIRKRIQSDLIEVFQNIFRHARTEDPCFICGQFYPSKGFFILTIVDLGVGFLPPIQEYTNGDITTHIDSIRWALSGKSTLVKDPATEIGGFGLEGILEYCSNNKGIFQIYSGTDFWGTDLEKSIWQGCRSLKHDFRGSMLNLFFGIK